MKKRIILTSTILLASLALAGCGNNQSTSNPTKAEDSSLRAENSSLKTKKSSERQAKYSEQDYALMAYLKLQGQTANELNRNKDNMNWNQDGNTYHIDFGAHTTSMTVTEDNVEVTYDKPQGDSMGQGNGHKNYSKHQLAREFGNQKGTIDEILESVSQRRAHNDGSANNGQQTKISNNTSSPAKQSSDDHYQPKASHNDHQTDTGNSDNDDNSSDFYRNIPSINTAVTSSANTNTNAIVTSSSNP